MLVLTRKPYESIVIGDSIRITPLPTLRSGTFRIGIDAPKDVVILREELLTDDGGNEDERKAG